MTNLEAIRAKMVPYELPEESLQLLLDEQGLEPSGVYSSGFLPEIKKAVIEGLYQCLTLTEESDNGSKLKYDPDALKDLIHHIEGEVLEKRPLQRDMTRFW